MQVFTESICRHGNLVLADLVDEDTVSFRRTSPISATIAGANALLTKPGQSIAPMAGWLLLNADTAEKLDTSAGFYSQTGLVMLGVPVLCALLQLFIWSKFSLHGKYLNQVKHQRKNLTAKGAKLHEYV